MDKTFFNFARFLLTVVGTVIFCYWIFHAYDLQVYEHVVSSDGLAILDFSRDFLRGEPLNGWHLSRAPYFFPDMFLAISVLSLGWLKELTLLIIASINYFLLVFCCYLVLRETVIRAQLSFLKVWLVVTACLIIIFYLFPFSLANLYWAIFVSGSHFGATLMVVLIFSLEAQKLKKFSRFWQLSLLACLTVLTTASNSMALLLLGCGVFSKIVMRQWKSIADRRNIEIILSFSVIGCVLNQLVPRESLKAAFFSVAQFKSSLHNFFLWLFSSPQAYTFMGALLCAPFIFSYFTSTSLDMKGSKKATRFTAYCLFNNPLIFPSFVMVIIIPFFWQPPEPQSLRYLTLPGFILLLCFCFFYFTFTAKIKTKKIQSLITIAWGAFLCFGLFSVYNQHSIKPTQKIKAEKIYACIESAASSYPLEDGIASYWNARPVKFYSNFNYYLAQTSPWSPQSGYFFYGNNSYDFVYKDTSLKVKRAYNYILASTEEVKTGAWGPILVQANAIKNCGDYDLFYFKNDKLLWNFLFPAPLLLKNEVLSK